MINNKLLKTLSKKNVILLISLASVLPGLANADSQVDQKSQELQRLTQSLQEKKKFQNEIENKFDSYIDARAGMMLSLCTQKYAEYQGTPLSKDFYKTMKKDHKNLEAARKSLMNTLNEAKSYFGTEFSNTIDKFYESEKQNSMPTEDQVTRGYCLNYQQGFDEKITQNLQRYQKQTADVQTTAHKENSVYLNSKYQLQNMTLKLDQQASPTVLIVGGKEFPIKCNYQDVQKYDAALATNHSTKEAAFKASDYFYQKLSPQIDYMITCTTEQRFPVQSKIAVGDTYPWYQPTVIGSNGTPAAGDALVYLDNKQVIFVLGHQPCVCSHGTEEQCNKVKKVSREFKTDLWTVISMLETDKVNHNLQDQKAINVFTSYAKNEIKKDFCFIDKKGIVKQIDMLEGMKIIGSNDINTH